MRCSATLGPQGFLGYFHKPSCNRSGANGGASAPKGTADRHVAAAAAAASGVARWGEGVGVVTMFAVIMFMNVMHARVQMFTVITKDSVGARNASTSDEEVSVIKMCDSSANMLGRSAIIFLAVV